MFKFYSFYLLTGIFCFLLDFISFTFFFNYLIISWMYSNLLSIFLSSLIGFYIYNRFVYKNLEIHTNYRLLFLYFLAILISLLLNQLLMFIQIEILLISPFISKFISSLFVVLSFISFISLLS